MPMKSEFRNSKSETNAKSEQLKVKTANRFTWA
jgi:hypothetical protein